MQAFLEAGVLLTASNEDVDDMKEVGMKYNCS